MSLWLARAADPDLVGSLRILQWTEAAPSLPFVTASTSSDEEVSRLRLGLREAIEEPALEVYRRQLGLAGAAVLSEEAYARILAIEEAAFGSGYGEFS